MSNDEHTFKMTSLSSEKDTLTDIRDNINEDKNFQHPKEVDLEEEESIQLNPLTSATSSGSKDETDTEANQLSNLGVQLVEQTSLEIRLQSNANKLLTEQSIAADQKRLVRTEKKLNQIRYELKNLQNKLNSPMVRISEKERLGRQIIDMTNGELKEAEQDIREISKRIDDYTKTVDDNENSPISGKAANGSNLRQPGETEKEFLIRTGRLTAFGNTAGFYVDEDTNNKGTEEANNAGPISHQNLIIPGFINTDTVIPSRISKLKDIKKGKDTTNENDYTDVFTGKDESEDMGEVSKEIADDEDYQMEEYGHEEDDEEEISDERNRKQSRLLTEEEIRNVDDGDDKFFELRLRTWVYHRSKNRICNSNEKKIPLDLPEWFKPHASHADATLTPEFKIPGDIFPSLFDYQRTGIQWLYELYTLSHGGIISDEMGLGKTIQIVGFIAGLHYSELLKKGKPVLIVCPATVLTQWVNEFHSWWGALRVMVLHSIGSGMKNGKNKKIGSEEELEEGLELEEMIYDENGEKKDFFKDFRDMSSVKRIMKTLLNCEHGGVLITSYVGLRIYEDHLLEVPWGYVVLDEGHKIKNPNANITMLAKRLKTSNRVILSGTPIQNNLLELWSLFDFVYPGRLGTLPVFIDEFETPIKVGGYANATNLQMKIGYQKAVILKDLIQPFLLRRMKVDVARDLPSKSEYVLMCRLTKFQKEKYLEFLRSLEFKVTSYLGAITTLRKICNHPDLVDIRFTNIKKSKSYGDPSRSGKLQVLKNLLKLWKDQGHKVLLFTQTKQMMYILEKFLINEYGPNYRFMKMSGETPISKRQDMIHTFNTTEFNLFLLTTKVGGLGVNLTGANRVIIFDPDWNPSTDLQARERAWRLGQKKDVVIYRLVIGGSIEEKIYHRQIFKMLLTDKILKDPNQKRGGFKNEELRDLFTLSDFQDDNDEDLLNGGAKEQKSLKNSQFSEDDLEDLKSIQGLSKMEKYKASSEAKCKEEDSLMSGLFKGTAKISKHDDIYESHAKPKDPLDSQVESHAKNEANKALEALKKSRRAIKKAGGIGVPTFTGRFGVAGKVGKPGVVIGTVAKSRSRSSTCGTDNNSKNSSALILAHLKQRSATEQSRTSTTESNSDMTNSKTLDSFIKFLQTRPDNFSKSKEILQGCGMSIKDNKDLILMRTLLKGICMWDQMKAGWVLKKEYR